MNMTEPPNTPCLSAFLATGFSVQKAVVTVTERLTAVVNGIECLGDMQRGN